MNDGFGEPGPLGIPLAEPPAAMEAAATAGNLSCVAVQIGP